MTAPEFLNGTRALGIDPGSSKCGLAVVQSDGEILFTNIIDSSELITNVQQLILNWNPDIVLLGNGTGSKTKAAQLAASIPDIKLLIVDESYTSEAARARYLKANPAKGFQRLVPPTLRSPDKPYDDYVAIILCERYFATRKAV